MRLTSVFVRFYKSFNYDYLRKIEPDIERRPWEIINERDGQFYPFVEMKIDAKTTAIVGSNGSGKSHLLSAVQKGVNGFSIEKGRSKQIEDKDFCRYSPFFKSAKGEQHFPDFGFAWALDNADHAIWATLAPLNAHAAPKVCWTFRFNKDQHTVYIPRASGSGYDAIPVSEDVLRPLMPHVFRIDSAVPLPDSVPIRQLIVGKMPVDGTWKDSGREFAIHVAEKAPELYQAINEIPAPAPLSQGGGVATSQVPNDLYQRLKLLGKELEPSHNELRPDERMREAERFNLAHDLLFKIAGVDPQQISLLEGAIREGESGLMLSIVDNINALLEKCLNFPRLWAQDRDFKLRVSASEHELAFVITDRTGRHYTFDERSSGLKHFLSYYIQFLAHEPQSRNEVLLMDEPDAFLSAEAQQDLLKVFAMFASQTRNAKGEVVPVQVIYVTHSPFLIDKNHSERVRAIVKGEGAQGTRVIKGEAHNHYEPLRSAFGAFVGETTFISGCNLMLEGQGDQVLLAGAASYLRLLETVPESELLDLNRITLVPGGGGSNVPYLAYLARGRDTEKPAIIVLLDSDKEGDESKTDLSKTGPHPGRKAVVSEQYILQLGEITRAEVEALKPPLTSAQTTSPNAVNTNGSLPSPDKEAKNGDKKEHPFTVLEDLIPIPLMARAAQVFAGEVFGLSEEETSVITAAAIESELTRLRESISNPTVSPPTAGDAPGAGAPMKRSRKQETTTQSGHYISAYDALNSLLQKLPLERPFEMSKVALSRTVVDLLPVLANEDVQFGNGEESGLFPFERTMRSLFRRLRRMQTAAEQDVRDKRQRQRVIEKITTFSNDYKGLDEVPRDAARSLFDDIERDLDGDDSERTFILRELLARRNRHALHDDLTQPVRDLPEFWNGLDRLMNSKELARRELPAPVASRKAASTVDNAALDGVKAQESDVATSEASPLKEPSGEKPPSVSSPLVGATE